MSSSSDAGDDELIRRIRAEARRSNGDLPPVATPELCDASERLLGTSLHPFHRRLLLEVANGGFGPGYRLFGLPPTAGDPSMLELRDMLKAVCDEELPAEIAAEDPDAIDALPRLSMACWRGLLAVCDWGCGSWSFIDSGSLRGEIVLLDDGGGLRETPFDIRTFFEAWVEDVDVEDRFYGPGTERAITNPFTRQPAAVTVRGAPLGRPYVEPARRQGT